jgi:cytochrome c553
VPYLIAKFDVITDHRRDNVTAETFMVPVLGSVDPEIRKAVATHFHDLNPDPAVTGPKELVGAGKKLYETGVPSEGVPACTNCHGADAKGKDAVPRLAGQIYPYTIKVLTNWTIINKEKDAVKAPTEHKLSDDQIAALSAYLSYLK